MTADVVVLGQIARDLTLTVPEIPAPEHSADVRARREILGGRGVNQAVGLTQLGRQVALVGVVGDDLMGDVLLTQARAEHLDISHVVRRPGAETALLVDILDGTGQHRHLDNISADVLLTERDVFAASELIGEARSVVVQLDQPFPAALEAARLAITTGTRVVLDGVPHSGEQAHELFRCAHVLHGGAAAAGRLVGRAVRTLGDAVQVGQQLLGGSLSLVVLELPGQGAEGVVFVQEDSYEFLPLADVAVVDRAGSSDALVAGLTCALTRGDHARAAARLAMTAVTATRGYTGRRPQLDRDLLDPLLGQYP